MAKSTQIEMDKRIEHVASMLTQGKKRPIIIEHGLENWDVQTAQIDNYIKYAKELLKEESANTKQARDVEFAKSMRVIVTIRNKCMAIQDYARALQAQKEINSLLALYEPQVHKMEHDIVDSTDEERVDRLAAIFDRLRDRRDRAANE